MADKPQISGELENHVWVMILQAHFKNRFSCHIDKVKLPSQNDLNIIFEAENIWVCCQISHPGRASNMGKNHLYKCSCSQS